MKEDMGSSMSFERRKTGGVRVVMAFAVSVALLSVMPSISQAFPQSCEALFRSLQEPASSFEVMALKISSQPRRSGGNAPVLVGQGASLMSVHVESQAKEEDLKVYFLDPVLGKEMHPSISLSDHVARQVLKTTVAGRDYIVVIGGSQLVQPRNESRSFIIDPKDGKVVAQFSFKEKPSDIVVIQKKSSTYMLALSDGKLFRVEIPSGAIKKIEKIDGLKEDLPLRTSIVERVKWKGKEVLIIATDKAVHVVNQETGELLERIKGDFHVRPVAFEHEGQVYVAALDRVPSEGLRILNVNTGKVSEMPLPLSESGLISGSPTLVWDHGRPSIVVAMREADHSVLAIVNPIRQSIAFSEPTPLIIDTVVPFTIGDSVRLLTLSSNLVPTSGFSVAEDGYSASVYPAYKHAVTVGYQFDLRGRYLGDMPLPGGVRAGPVFFEQNGTHMMTYSGSLIPVVFTHAVHEPGAPVWENKRPQE